MERPDIKRALEEYDRHKDLLAERDLLLQERAALQGLADERDTLRAERDRLRGEVEKWKVCHRGAWEENEALAAENAGLRGALESALREANEASNGADQCAVIALGIEAALSSTSPLTSAVERVLEAVGKLFRARIDAVENELREAHDHLRALLEGRS